MSEWVSTAFVHLSGVQSNNGSHDHLSEEEHWNKLLRGPQFLLHDLCIEMQEHFVLIGLQQSNNCMFLAL